MATGVVKWFNLEKRFGFLKPDDGAGDVFIHISALQAAGLSGLEEGQRLEYELVDKNGKSSATNLRLID